MQLGYTIPLQRHLNANNIPYGAPCDLRHCWELHILRPGGRPSLFCVHASSRYAFLLYALPAAAWADVPTLFVQVLGKVLEAEGIPSTAVEWYFSAADKPEITRTHGRRPVAFLNQAVNDLYALPVGLAEEELEQVQVRLFLNEMPCQAAGHQGKGTAREFLHRDLAMLADNRQKRECILVGAKRVKAQ